MSELISILRAAHCHSTHHYFALDALRCLKTAQSQRLANILLKYHDDYLTGAKAPDSSFKDFSNHVIHVSDLNWGGAAGKCLEWLHVARGHLDQGRWKKAAYACGVLSHYFTDPIMPLHTAGSQAEAIVHRPMEWSVYRAYQEIYQQVRDEGIQAKFDFTDDQDWIAKAVLASASVAHRHYDDLIQSYDMQAGATDPRLALNAQSRAILAELFALAIHGWAGVLTRLADETTKQLPNVSLTMASLLATIDKPLAWLVRRISDSSERRAVQAVFQEFQKTGTVVKHLSAEVKAVRAAILGDKQHLTKIDMSASQRVNADLAAIPDSGDHQQTAFVDPKSEFSELSNVEMPVDTADFSVDSLSANLQEVQPAEISSGQTSQVAALSKEEFVSLAQARSHLKIHRPVEADSEAAFGKSQASSSSALPQTIRLPSESSDLPVPSVTGMETVSRAENHSLAQAAGLKLLPESLPEPEETEQMEAAGPKVQYGSPLVDAPSIGPKTAKRFADIDIHTIAQFVGTGPEQLVQELATKWITENLVRDWQDQARLVCEVPTLPGYGAQLLVAIGCRTAWQLRTANKDNLKAQLDAICMTAEGQHILRSSKPPSAQRIESWIQSARDYARRHVA
ncbi:MAG TPA: hypothetical protein DCF63_17840 [Planctomycetaceae bacterium]|nr:hypothetical protein [Planctomycetaceae bacterium]